MPLTISQSEYLRRQKAVAKELQERGLDALVVWSNGSSAYDYYAEVQYLTNHHASTPHIPDNGPFVGGGRAALVIDADGDVRLVTTSHIHPDDAIYAREVIKTLDLPKGLAQVVNSNLGSEAKVGISGRDSLLHSHYVRFIDSLEHKPSVIEAEDILDSVRLIKSDEEMAALRYAGQVGSRWMSAMMEAAEPGMTEADIVAAGLPELIKLGGYPYDISISSGPSITFYRGSAGVPHWNKTRKLEPGDMLRIDAWGPVKGYYTDIMRSKVVGAPADENQQRSLEGAKGVINHLIETASVGQTFGDLYQSAIDWLDREGFAPSLGDDGKPAFPLFGHGIGVNVETQHIVAGDPTIVQPNMALAFEAVVPTGPNAMAGIEENVLTFANKVEVLTADCPQDW